MIARCYYAKNQAYEYYGGRGIAVCERWHKSFTAFALDMEPRPAGMTLERKDNSGGYWCGRCEECVSLGRVTNVVWASRAEQNRNTRKSVVIDVAGRRQVQAEWARELGLNTWIIRDLRRRGMTPAQAVLSAMQRAAKRNVGAGEC